MSKASVLPNGPVISDPSSSLTSPQHVQQSSILPAHSKPSPPSDDKDILKELCSINGINYEGPVTEHAAVDSIETFFDGFPRFVCLAQFSNLTRLCVIGQEGLATINGISTLTKLTELWVAECSVKVITGIVALHNLEKLYLYDNVIEEIGGLETLPKISTLWLNTNRIVSIQNLACLIALKDLNLADNKIERLGSQLLHHPDLSTLNLSGNRISSLKGLTCLQGLPALKHLSLGDSKYARNPVCHLCNYHTHLLYHMPGLRTLDGHDVQAKSVRDMADSTVMKKKMYYRMRLKALKKRLVALTKRMDEYKTQQLTKDLNIRLRQLWCSVKMLDKALEDASESENPETGKTAVIGMLEVKRAAIMARIIECTQRCDSFEDAMRKKVLEADKSYKAQCSRLMMELDTVGNVRFEDGTPKDVWFNSCHELILSRFCAADYKAVGVQGIKINRITRVYNRTLRLRFDEKVAEISGDTGLVESNTYRPPNVKNNLEYLFWVWNPMQVGLSEDATSLIEDGFHTPPLVKANGRVEAICMSNSVSLADRLRISKSCHVNPTDVARGGCPFRYGKLILAKTYIGQSEAARTRASISRDAYPNCNSVYQSYKENPLLGVLGKNQHTAGSRTTSLSEAECDCGGRQCDWFLFDKDLVVPEYFVDFEYITEREDTNPFSMFDCVLLQPPQIFRRSSTTDSDSDVLSMQPTVSARARLTSMKEDVILELCQAPSLLHINELNLHDNRLTSLSGIQELVHLRKLYVSFNEIQRIDDLTNMKLTHLDCSFNKIYTLDGIKNLAYIKFLDVSWNLLRYIRDEIAIIRKHVPVVEDLRISGNLWLKPIDLRLRVISRLKTLQTLDDKKIEEGESTAALRLMAGSRVSQVSLLFSARCDGSRPRSLSLQNSSQVLHRKSPYKLDRMGTGEQDLGWMTKITSLCLDGQHLGKLSNLERLENLKWASFANNDIVKMEGMECCKKLEELCLEGNCIYKLEGISALTNLRKLDVSDNFLTVMETGQFDRLVHLHLLSVDHNKLQSLAGLQKATGLMELYAHQNRIGNQRDVFYLKSLSSLSVLDLGDNPICSQSESHRLYVIYHLSWLKALDGLPVDPSEIPQSKEMFGGRLTPDFIIEKMGLISFDELKELEFPQCSIRHIDLGTVHQFGNLRSINLEHNGLSNFGGLVNLPNLRVLCLNHNHIESLFPKARPNATGPGIQQQQQHSMSMDPKSYPAVASHSPLLESLEVLHLGYNGIKDLVPLRLSRIVNLKALFLQGNEIQLIAGLEGLRELRELVLDKNKIKVIPPGVLSSHWLLEELHLEENRIRGDLGPALGPLISLQRLYLGMNRIQDLSEMESIQTLTKLVELSVVSNPVSRRLLHRPLLVHRMRSLVLIDGIPVSEEERARADMAYLQQEQQLQQQDIPGVLPGIQQGTLLKSQVKVTNVSLGSFIERVPWSGTLQYDPAVMQNMVADGQRIRRVLAGSGNGSGAMSLGSNPFAKGSGTGPAGPSNGPNTGPQGPSSRDTRNFQDMYSGPFHQRGSGKK